MKKKQIYNQNSTQGCTDFNIVTNVLICVHMRVVNYEKKIFVCFFSFCRGIKSDMKYCFFYCNIVSKFKSLVS